MPTMTWLLLWILVSCTASSVPVAHSDPRASNTEESALSTDLLQSPELTSDADWAPYIEQQLLRSARSHAPPFVIEQMRCYRYTCRLLVRDVTKAQTPSAVLRQWIASTWTFHWMQNDVVERVGKPAALLMTLYRHPADRNRGEEPGFSSIKGELVPPCQMGADCSHRNWNDPYICDWGGCPSIRVSGRSRCFESLQLACACIHAKGLKPPDDFPSCGPGEFGYPY
jgi:hypothetical protein